MSSCFTPNEMFLITIDFCSSSDKQGWWVLIAEDSSFSLHISLDGDASGLGLASPTVIWGETISL